MEYKGRAKGGYARAEALSPEQRTAQASKAAQTRWHRSEFAPPLKQPAGKANRNVVTKLLQFIGEDVTREGLRETPERYLKSLKFCTSGYGQNPAEVLKMFEDGAAGYDAMVFQANIPCFSFCEHHIVPFFGLAHIAYIPNNKIVGLSKLARLLDIFARRLQVQERLCSQVADALWKHLDPDGVGVVLKCRHLCLEMRGVQKPGTITITSALRGSLKDDAATRAEFMALVNSASERSIL